MTRERRQRIGSFRQHCAESLSKSHFDRPLASMGAAYVRAVLIDTDAVLIAVRAEMALLPCYPSCSDHEPCQMCELREYLET